MEMEINFHSRVGKLRERVTDGFSFSPLRSRRLSAVSEVKSLEKAVRIYDNSVE